MKNKHNFVINPYNPKLHAFLLYDASIHRLF